MFDTEFSHEVREPGRPESFGIVRHNFLGYSVACKDSTKARFQSSSRDVFHDFYFGVSTIIIDQH